MKSKTPESVRAAIARYDSANTRKVTLKLNLKTDADIVERLDREPNKQGYIKTCIRERIKKETP